MVSIRWDWTCVQSLGIHVYFVDNRTDPTLTCVYIQVQWTIDSPISGSATQDGLLVHEVSQSHDGKSG
jgi:hypothetical protein